MKKQELMSNFYNPICYQYLNIYLFFKPDLEKLLPSFNSILGNTEYLKILKQMLEKMVSEYHYPKEAYHNIGMILPYIERNIELDGEQEKLLEECFNIYQQIEHFSNDYFYDEFDIKYNDLKDYLFDSIHVWSKKDMIESICYDYFVYVSLSSSSSKYIEQYMPEFILNKKYILSINKILYEAPFILEVEEFKDRIKGILKANITYLEDIEDEQFDLEVLNLYARKNYEVPKAKQITIPIEELQDFKQKNLNLLEKIDHNRDYLFTFEYFKTYYESLKLEYHLFFDYDYDVSDISLNTIYSYLETSKRDKLLGNNQKNELINVMDQKKQELLSNMKPEDKKTFLKEYNKNLVELNEYVPNELGNKWNQVLDRLDFGQYLIKWIKTYISDPHALDEVFTSQEYDLDIFDMYLLSDEEFEQIKKRFVTPYTAYCIRKFSEDSEHLFLDPLIYSRTKEVLTLENTKNSRKVLRKIDKIKR